MKRSTIKQSLAYTLIYADIFNFPLTRQELFYFLITSKYITKTVLENFLDKNKLFSQKENYFFLKNRSNLVKKRLVVKKESERKIMLAKKIAKKIAIIPTVQLIGVSGSVAIKNATKEDDIDLFIIAKKNTLWITRFMIIIFLNYAGYYRKRNASLVKNKICLNMLMEDTALQFFKYRQNIYTAHEIMQILPLFERNDTYNTFLLANTWIKKYLANAYHISSHPIQNATYKRVAKDGNFSFLLKTINNVSKKLQMILIKRHQTTEEVRGNFAAFHPNDYTKFVIDSYETRTKQYNKNNEAV